MARRTTGPPGPSLTTVQSLAVASQFGVALAAAVGLGLLAGSWLDAQLKTSFVFTLIGAFLGLAGALSSTVTVYRALLRRSAEQRARTLQSADPLAEDDHSQR